MADADLELDAEAEPLDSLIEQVDSRPRGEICGRDNPCNDPIQEMMPYLQRYRAGHPRWEPCSVHAPRKSLDWTDDQDGPVCARAYWADIEHAVGQTPHDRPVGLVCHNCYAQPGRGVKMRRGAATRNLIRNAQLAGADLIELDLKEEGSVIYAHEDDDGTGGSRFDVVGLTICRQVRSLSTSN